MKDPQHRGTEGAEEFGGKLALPITRSPDHPIPLFQPSNEVGHQLLNAAFSSSASSVPLC